MAIRLRHHTLRSCVYVVETGTPFASGRSKMCPTCKAEHAQKALHFRLNSEGYTFTSSNTPPDVMRTLEFAGLEPVNEVGKPPALQVGMVSQPTLEVNQNGSHHYVPPRTKYESRDIMTAPYRPILEALAELKDREETSKKAEKRKIFDIGKRGK